MSNDDIVAAAAFFLTIGGLVVAYLFGAWKHTRGGQAVQQQEGPATGPGPPWLARIAGMLVPVLALAFVFLMATLGWRAAIAALLSVLSLAAALLVGVVWWVRRHRMRYSPEGAAALARVVATLRARLLDELGIVAVEGIWAFDYPKVLVLFDSDSALQKARTSGALTQFATEVAGAVRGDAAFGRNRETFKSSEAVWATSSREAWNAVTQASGAR